MANKIKLDLAHSFIDVHGRNKNSSLKSDSLENIQFSPMIPLAICGQVMFS